MSTLPPSLQWELKQSRSESTILTCGVCCEIVKSPLKLICGHLFCVGCLNIRMGSGAVTGMCPLCDKGGILPSSIDQNAFSALTRLKEKTRIKKLCDWCEKFPADADCLDCKTSLCSGCVTAVHSRRIMATHRITTLSSLPESDSIMSPITSMAQSERCELPNHDRNIIKYHCGTCHTSGCSVCIADLHSGHAGVVPINSLDPFITQSLSQSKELMASTKTRLKELLSELHQTTLKFDGSAESLEKVTGHFFIALRKQVDAEESDIRQQIRELKSEGKELLDTCSSDVMMQLDKVNRHEAEVNAVTRDLDHRRVHALKLLSEDLPKGDIAIPRGDGLQYQVPAMQLPVLRSLFDIKLGLSKDNKSFSKTLSLSFSNKPNGVAITSSGSIDVSSLGSNSCISLKSNCIISKLIGVHSWKVHLSTFGMMLGVVSESETRPDLHRGCGFFWYADVQGASYGTMGSATEGIDDIPPLETLPNAQTSGVTVVFTYDPDAETLSVSLNGISKGVIGTKISPPVVPAFVFVSEKQRLIAF